MQDFGQKLMQHLIKINLVPLQKLIETVPQRMHTKIKGTGDWIKY